MNLNTSKSVNYHYDQFPPKEINYGLFINELYDAVSSIARYDQMLKNMHNSEVLLSPLRSQEAVISSRMEGTISTMDEILEFDATAMEGDNEEPDNFWRTDIFETWLYKRTLKKTQSLLEEGYEFSPILIKLMHQGLLSFGRGANKVPGSFKTEQNYLGDKFSRNIHFIPISPEKLQDGLDSLFTYWKQSNHISLIKAALIHLEFEALHPFQDGNGRIGRMLITLFLWREGVISQPHFYISGYFENHKDEYIQKMRAVSEKGEWDEWCKFFLKAIASQANNNLRIAETINELYVEMKSIFSDILSSKYTLKALDFIFTHPVFRNSKFTSQSGIPSQTAAGFTKKLESQGLLKVREEAAGRKSTLYSFEPLMQLVRV